MDPTGPRSASDASNDAGRDHRAAMRADDGFVATFFSARVANALLRRMDANRVTPNQVTVASLLAALAAALLFASGGRIALVLGALLVQASFVFDCLDGQLARHTGRTSRFGAWLDGMTDCLQEVVLLGGLAIGCARSGLGLGPVAWSYAAILVVLYRSIDWLLLGRVLGAAYADLGADATATRTDPTKVRVIAEARERGLSRWGPVGHALDRLAPKGTHETNPLVFWTKRALQLRNGERYAVISILALLGRPEWVFPVLVLWGGLVYPLITARRWQLFAT